MPPHAVAVVARVNLLDLDRGDLEAFFVSLGEKPFRASQVLKWVYHEEVTDFDAMTNLSKTLRERLKVMAEVQLPEVVSDHASQDDSRKWLVRLESGDCVEMVFIPEAGRGTLCVSSQIGCALNCAFCATAQQGFNGNLTVAEIMGQLWQANRLLGGKRNGNPVITNVVMMGMGEPLLNFNNVVKAMNLMQDDLAYGLSKRRITLSTAGVVPALHRLRDVTDVSLAVSLHAPTDELRNQLVPLNRKYPIAELLDACRRYIADKPYRRVTWEYVMLAGVNDSAEHALALAKLVEDIPSKINLIPFNPFPDTRYRCSSQPTVDRFRDILLSQGLTAITRKTRGEDIAAACGQLAGRIRAGRQHQLRPARLAQPAPGRPGVGQ